MDIYLKVYVIVLHSLTFSGKLHFKYIILNENTISICIYVLSLVLLTYWSFPI